MRVGDHIEAGAWLESGRTHVVKEDPRSDRAFGFHRYRAAHDETADIGLPGVKYGANLIIRN